MRPRAAVPRVVTRINRKMMLSRRHGNFTMHQEQDERELTDGCMVDRLVVCGSVGKVVDDILRRREETASANWCMQGWTGSTRPSASAR